MSRSIKFLLLCSLILNFSTAFRAAGPMPLPVAATQAATAEGVKVPNTGLRPDAPDYAKHGPFWVGVSEFETKTDSHPTTVAVWYPALNPDGANEILTYRQSVPSIGIEATVQGHAIENAKPQVANGPYPLVIFAHGSSGIRFYYAYLTEHLASYGFVVMAIDYSNSPVTPDDDGDLPTVFTGPKDVSWQIDYAQKLTGAGGEMPGLIDIQHIAVSGHSAGAFTTQMAGGAQLDLNGPTSWCVLYPGLKHAGDPSTLKDDCDNLIQELPTLAGLKSAPNGLWPSWGDARVKAIVQLAPVAVYFGADSFKGVTIPTMIMVGSKDDQMFSDLPQYRPTVYDNLGSASKSLVTFENAGHQLYFFNCSDGPWVVDLGLHWACSDPVWDMARAHDLINHFTTAFLLDALKGDKEAHKALLPDAVQFVGIQYRTTMN